MENKVEKNKEVHKEDEKSKQLTNSLKLGDVLYVSSFFNENSINKIVRRRINTGIDNLDKIISGGFLEGSINVLAGSSAVGKSSFSLQIAGEIAKETPVIYITLEMSQISLFSKLLSSKLFLQDGLKSESTKTSTELMGPETKNFSLDDWKKIDVTINEIQSTYQDKLFIVYPRYNSPTITWIVELINNFLDEYKRVPFVIIDYLQLISPNNTNKNMTDKQIVDMTLEELRKLSIEKKVTFLLISSLNRESYDKPVTMSSLKESGNIEFSADLILGMNPCDLEKRTYNFQAISSNSVKRIELKVLKQRYGQCSESIMLDFYPKYSYFECGKQREEKVNVF